MGEEGRRSVQNLTWDFEYRPFSQNSEKGDLGHTEPAGLALAAAAFKTDLLPSALSQASTPP